ncbi:7-carboxy-7-deazaguanine synthase QueE [Alteromonas sp. 5E99-2]|nr:7-carboxy-7-deazaguanine synthase QueE [Alteromonas sp. 5E99-2]MBO1256038.1 7-carboxy-7-deazaguanine synthase QueE [Alteromonas sp. 5E99-2]
MLPINEMFETIQGEGVHTGVPSIFVRLQGCPIGCAWCDTKHTWDVTDSLVTDSTTVIAKTEDTPSFFRSSVSELLSLFSSQGYAAKHVVITGGEPCMYDLVELTTSLYQAGYSAQIETSGTFEIKCHEDTWVTVSPKVGMKGGYKVLASAMNRANEIKHPVAKESHIADLDTLLALREQPIKHICLQPISQQKRATDLAVRTCIQRNWRLSLQTHKYLGIA